MDERPPARRVTLSGFVVAGIGFLLTRFTVTLAVSDNLTRFVLAGLVPLMLGLVLSAFGVALAVGAFKPAFVRTVAVWCVLGTGAMVVLVSLTLLGIAGGMPTGAVLRSEAYLSNFVIGGSIGGTLTGVYAGLQNQHEQSVREHSNRLKMLNRILRDEVINAMFAIEGHLELARADRDGATETLLDVVDEKGTQIQATIDDVKYLSRTADEADVNLEPIALRDHVEAAVDAVESNHPDASCAVTFDAPAEVTVWANALLERVIRNLVDNAVRYSGSPTPAVEVTVTTAGDRVAVTVADDGPGLPADQRALLEDGTIADHDDPTTGFGLNVVRLLTESYGGEITTTVAETGTTVTLDLQRAQGSEPAVGTSLTDVRSYGVAPTNLLLAAGSALVAGAAMGAVMQAISGTVPVIGALYGVTNPLVGWVTHQFHSVVFGMIYPALLAVAPDRDGETVGRRLGLAFAWGLALWLVAAGFVMPVWLRLVDIAAPLPNLTISALVGHLLWAAVLGACYEVGSRAIDG